MEFPWDGLKIYSNVPGHVTKMASRPIMIKTFKILFLRNQEADYIETWYICKRHQILKHYQIYSNSDTGLTMTIFMTWSHLFPNASAWVKAYTAYDHVYFISMF